MIFLTSRKSSIVYCWCPVLSCLTLCNSTDCSTPGFPVLHHLPELLKLMFIESGMPSRPLLPSSPPALNLFQHQVLFQWVSSWHQVAKGLELQLTPCIQVILNQVWYKNISCCFIPPFPLHYNPCLKSRKWPRCLHISILSNLRLDRYQVPVIFVG